MSNAINNSQIAITQQAEVKAMEAVDGIESSKFGKILPTEIDHIYVSDIVKWLMVSTFSNYLPMFIIFGRKFNNYFDWVRLTINIIFNIGFISLFILCFITYISSIQDFYKFVVLGVLLKNISISILTIMAIINKGWVQFLVGISYISYILLLDFVFLYYLAIYLKRMNSSEFDDLGVKIEHTQEKV